MNDDINLAEESNKEEPTPTGKSVTDEMMADEHYPELAIRGVADEGLASLPDEGHFAIKGKVVHRETHTHPRTGKKTHSLRMKVASIRHTGKHHVSAKEHGNDVKGRLEAAEFPSNA